MRLWRIWSREDGVGIKRLRGWREGVSSQICDVLRVERWGLWMDVAFGAIASWGCLNWVTQNKKIELMKLEFGRLK
jgi:hypothetical protein